MRADEAAVTVKPRAKTATVEQLDKTHFVVRVKEPAHEGKANSAVIKALALFLDIAPSCILLTKGASSKHKVIEIV